MRRRLLFAGLALAAAAVALLLVVHAPPVRAAVLRYALRTVQDQYGIRLDASRLDYSLATLRAGLADVRVAAAATPGEPFVEADYISVVVPWRALTGPVELDEVTATNARIRIVRRADGTSNLPETPDGGDEEPAPLLISRIAIPRLAVDITDEAAGLVLRIPDLAIALARDEGRIALSAPATIQVGERRTMIEELSAAATFDGRTLQLTNGTLRADEATATVDGSITLIAEEPAVDLRLAGTGDVARLAAWAMSDGDAPSGTVAFDARVSGPMNDPQAALDATSARIGWRGLEVVDLSARAVVSAAAFGIEELRFGLEGGRVEVRGVLPFGADEAARAQVAWSGIPIAPLVQRLAPGTAVTPAATLSGDASLQSPLSQTAQMDATVVVRAAAGATRRGRVGIGGDARLELRNGRWTFTGNHRVGGVLPLALALRGSVDDAMGDARALPLDGDIRIAPTDVPALVEMLRATGLAEAPPDAVTAGTVEGTMQLAGTIAAPRVSFDLLAPDRVVAQGQSIDNLQVAGQLVGDALTIDRLSATQPDAGGELMVSGIYELERQRYEALLDMSSWDIVPTADLPLAAIVNGRFSGSGTIEEPAGVGEIALRDVVWDGTFVGDIDGDVRLEAGTAIVDARMESVDLARVLENVETPVPVSGMARVMAHAEAPIDALESAVATVEVSALEARAGDLPVSLVEPARLRYADDRVTVEQVEAMAGDLRVSASGSLPLAETIDGDTGMFVVVAGDVADMARAAAATGVTDLPLSGGEGPISLFARVTGSLQAPVVAADLEVGPGSLTLQDLPPITDVRLRAHAEGGRLELRELTAAFQDARIAASGEGPLAAFTREPGGADAGQLRLTGQATNLTTTMLEPFVDATTLEQLSGSIDASIELSSRSLALEDVTGSLTLDRFNVRLADLPITQRGVTRIVARDGLARIEAWDWIGQGAIIGVRGQIRLADRQMAVLVNGAVDMRTIIPFVRAAGISTAGRLEPRLSITGALDAPRIDGDLSLTRGEIRMADPRVLVSDLTARAVLSRRTAIVTAINGLANGGPLTGTGAVEYQPDGLVTASLDTSIRGMALEFPAGLRSEIDAVLALALRAGGAARPSGSVSGTVTVVRGAYREPLAVATGLLTTLRTQRLAAAAAPSPLLDGLALDVRVLTDEDVIVDNNYGRFQIGADLRLIGTAAVPALSGRLELREGGQLFVGRNVYTVNFGSVDFANPLTIQPDLNVEAVTRAGGAEIEVTITGTPEDLSLALDSPTNPELGQAELTSLLLTGRNLEDLAPGDAAFIGTQVLGNFSAEVLGFASRAIGLDTLRLGGVDGAVRRDTVGAASEIDPTTRLTFGKSITPNLEVMFSQSLRDSDAQTWIVDYLPVRRVDLRFVSDDENFRSLSLRHDVTFGTGPRVSRAGGAARREEPRVADVRFTGALELPEATLRSRVQLEPGDRFDFGRWQDDRDRLEQLYRNAGFFTARVSASREGEGETVALIYDVAPGPRTTIEIEGIAPSPGLQARLRDAWAQSVFDEFLIDEVAGIVRAVLAADGYLRPDVQVAIAGDDVARTLRIAVERGTRVTETAVRVTAADPAVGGEVSAWIETQELAARAVLDPGSLEEAVGAYLVSNGYLRARVTAGAPQFEGTSASVPLALDEGPQFRIVGLRFEGVSGLPADMVRDAAALSEGAPYNPVAAAEASDRLLALYRREGFVAPAVDLQPTIAEASPAVDLLFLVAEGPRQLLSEIAIAGNRAIDSGVILDALDLTPDAPLRVEEVLRARTRVFDTGLFRRVDIAPETVEAETPDAAVRPTRLRVTVEEWPALRLRYGFQVAEQRPETEVEGRDLVPGLSADITRRTLFGRALTTGAAVEYERREQSGRVFITVPALWRLPIESSLVLERSRESFSEPLTLVTDRSSIVWEQRIRLLGSLSLSYAYRFDRDHTFDTVPPIDPFDIPFDLTINIARITGSAAWDTRDDPYNTTRGLLASTSLEFAPEAAGSDIRFARQLAQGYYFRPWRGTVLASAARFGVVTPLGGQDLIPSERFFGGGARTVRGVPEGSLGGLDFFGDPTGGQSLLVLNQEVRFPIYGWLGGVAFVDAGNVFATAAATRLGDLVGATGAGLRLNTPFALLRVDYGRPVWNRPEETSGRWTFGIGQAF